MEGLLWLSERYRWFWFNERKGWTVLIGVASVGVAMLAHAGWFIVALVFRWRFQFSIRSLLVLVVVVAIPFSWLAVEMKAAREQKQVVTRINETEGWIAYDYQFDPADTWIENPQPPEPSWLRYLIGDDFFFEIVEIRFEKHLNSLDEQTERVPKVTNADLAEYPKRLPRLRNLTLSDTGVTEVGLSYLKGVTNLESLRFTRRDGVISAGEVQQLGELRQLRYLSLWCMEITDADLQHLECLTELQSLQLACNPLTDQCLVHLSSMAQLKSLNLRYTRVTDSGLQMLAVLNQLLDLNIEGTKITDVGLEHLKGLKQLRELRLGDTQVTDAGLEHLTGLTQLRELDLSRTCITNNGLKHLKGLTHLESVWLIYTPVTDEGVKELKRASADMHDQSHLQSPLAAPSRN